MKTPSLILTALLLLATASVADSPDSILKDYRTAATAALEKVNATLEKAVTPIIADLVKAGDTAAAEAVRTQLAAKLEGEPLLQPHPKAAKLFTQYDAARLKALEPSQKAAVHRIEGVLASSEGRKLDTVNTLAQIRAEIENGKILPVFDWLKTWAILYEKNGEETGKVVFNTDGSAVYTSKVGNKTLGAWVVNQKNNSLKVTFPKDEWMVVQKQKSVEMQSKALPNVAYLVAKE